MEENARLKSTVARLEASPRGVLRVTATSLTLLLLGESVAALQSQYPEVRVSLRQRDALGAAEDLVYDRADIGIGGSGMIGKADVVTRPLSPLKYSVIVPRTLLSWSGDSPTIQDLATVPLLAYPENYPERRLMDKAFSRAGLTPDIAVTGDTAFLLACAAAGIGVAVICGASYSFIENNMRISICDGSSLFDDAQTWLGVRRGKLLRNFEAWFCRYLGPELDVESFQKDILTRDPGRWESEFSI